MFMFGNKKIYVALGFVFVSGENGVREERN